MSLKLRWWRCRLDKDLPPQIAAKFAMAEGKSLWRIMDALVVFGGTGDASVMRN